MEKHIIDITTGIPYTLVGDYYLPWGDLPDDEPKHRPTGIWGQRHLRYIKQHRRALHTELMVCNKLDDYLANLNDEAEEMFSRLLKQMVAAEGITEQLKVEDQMAWISRMNSIRSRAMEAVYADLIYK